MKPEGLSAEKIIGLYHLERLQPEGGWFTRTYLATEVVPQSALAGHYSTPKAFGSAILYLYTGMGNGFSRLHRLPTDEIYHYYLGDPVEMLLLFPDGTSRQILMGHDLLAGQQVQVTVPAGVWQGSRLLPGGEVALIGTTMAPAYTDDDFELADSLMLFDQYPHEIELIQRLV